MTVQIQNAAERAAAWEACLAGIRAFEERMAAQRAPRQRRTASIPAGDREPAMQPNGA
jgi:hypothetical protein